MRGINFRASLLLHVSCHEHHFTRKRLPPRVCSVERMLINTIVQISRTIFPTSKVHSIETRILSHEHDSTAMLKVLKVRFAAFARFTTAPAASAMHARLNGCG